MNSMVQNNDQVLDNRLQFISLGEQLRDWGASIGIKVVPFHSRSLPFFSNQPLDKQTQILDDLSCNVRVCQLVMSNGERLSDPVAMTWNAIKELGLRPTSDLFSFITHESIIEIHNSQGCQLYRNLHFYSYCSYTLEELYCFSWNYLYSRDESILNGLLNIAGKIYTGAIKTTVRTDLPTHLISELNSPFRYQIEAEVDYISPLFDVRNRPVATIAIERGKLVGNVPSASEEEQLLSQHTNGLHSFDLV